MDFDRTWSDLNDRLRRTESGGGLTAALAELEDHQRTNGFIRDDLSALERRTFHHPDDPTLTFAAQYNPKRALRFDGTRLGAPPPNTESLNGGCFLCRQNIRWQQNQLQVGFEIDMTGDLYCALMNPFPLFPNHVVFAAADHISQEWDMAGDGRTISSADLLHDLCELAARLPTHVGFHNGVDAGASIPGHLHFQFLRRLDASFVFPLERRRFDRPSAAGEPELVIDYPLRVARWHGAVAEVVAAASAWADAWAAGNRGRLTGLSSNFIAAGHADGGVTLYFIPRDRAKARWLGMHGLVGGLEVLGELVLSSDEERKLLEDGVIDYAYVERALASVRTPLFAD